MEKKDLYEILGVSKTATQDEIKSAFRKLAKEYHPDMHKNEQDKKKAEEKFKEIASAYKILSDPEQRERYDRYGWDALKTPAGSGYSEGFDFDSIFNFDMGDIFSDFSDIFGDFLGFESQKGRARGKKRKGSDIRYDIEIDFFEAVFGAKKVIEIKRKESCINCNGSGLKPGSKMKVCSTCGGHGKVRQSQGFFTIVTTCPKCHGQGEFPEQICPECKGEGVQNKKRKIEIKIPAGIENESYIKLENEGNEGSSGYKGDLYVVIHIKEHPFFKRQGDDVIINLPVTIGQAVLGDEIEVPTIYGLEKIKIPNGIQNGEIITLKNKGFQKPYSSSKGAMHLVVNIEIPKNPNSKLKELFNQVKNVETENDYFSVKEFNKIKENFKKGEKNG